MFSMVVTPMDDQGRLDEAGIRAHLRRQIDAGVGVYLGSGGSGEGHALTIDELAQLYRIGVDECKGKVPVYCNPPEARSANEMLDKSRQAIDAGADLVQFYQLDAGHGRVPVLAEQEMYFRDLLEAIDHPVGISIHLAVGYLAPCVVGDQALPRLSADQVGQHSLRSDDELSRRICSDTIPDTIKIYVGMHNILSGLAMGAWGAQVTETNQIPHLCQAMIDEFVAGDVARAAETYAARAAASPT